MNAIFFRIPVETAKILIKELNITKCINISRFQNYTDIEFAEVEVINFDYKIGFETAYSQKEIADTKPIDQTQLRKFAQYEQEYMFIEERIGRNIGQFWDGTEVYFDNKVYDFAFNKYYYAIERKSYFERKNDYIKNLKFWSTFIEKHSVNVMFTPPIPHMPFSFILHKMLEEKKIPVIYQAYSHVPYYTFPVSNIKDDIRNFHKKYQQFNNSQDKLSLNKDFKNELQRITFNKEVDFMPPLEKKLIEKKLAIKRKQNSIKTKVKKLTNLIFHQVFKLIDFNYLYYRYRLKKTQQNFIRYRNLKMIEPDLNANFFYFPLHFQPEATSAPLGELYADQLLIIDMISKLLPKGFLLYVKEHPQQNELMRSYDFYKQVSGNYKNVSLIRTNYSSKILIEKSKAIVTIIGTAAWEGFGKEKPALLFGNDINQIFEGSFSIETTEDCKNAIHQIIRSHFHPTLKQLNKYMLFLQSISYKAFEYPKENEKMDSFKNMAHMFIDKYNSLK